MVHRPAQTKPTTISQAMSSNVETMTQRELQKLLAGSATATVYHRTDSSAATRVVFERVSTNVLKAFSPVLAAQFAARPHGNTSAVTITGGAFAAAKAVIKWMMAYAKKLSDLPMIAETSPILDWMQIHQMADILQIEVFKGAVMVELRPLMEERVIKMAELSLIVENLEVGSEYIAMTISSMVKAIASWDMCYTNTPGYTTLETQHPKFFKLLQDSLDEVQAAAEKAERDRIDAINANYSREIREEMKKYWTAMEEREAKAAAASEAASKSWAGIATKGATAAAIVRTKTAPAPAPLACPRLAPAAQPVAQAAASPSTQSAAPTGRTWADAARAGAISKSTKNPTVGPKR